MVSTKYNGAFVSFALVAAHVLRTILSGGLRAGRVLADGRLWMAVGLSIVALVAATPYLILAWKQYLSVVSYQTSSLAFSMSQTHAWLWIAQAYLTEEYLLGALMLGGLTLAFVRRHPFDWMLLAAWVPSFLYIGTWTRESLHYLLQFHPVLALMAARLVTVLWDHGRAHARARSGLLAGAMVVVIVAGALIINGVRVVEAGRLLTVPDTRALASKWIEAHVPAGSKVAMTWLPYCPRLDMISARESILRYAGNRPGVRQALREQWLSRPAFRFVNLEGWLKQPVVPEAYRDHIDLDDPETRRVFSRGWRSLEILKRDGVQWVVLPEAVYERYMGAAEPMANTAAHYRYTSNRAYFASLMAAESGLKLVARFPTDSASEGSGEQEPPLPSRGGGISIYRVL